MVGIEDVKSGGTDTRAEVVSRMVRDRVCHSMPEAMDGNDRGRVERYCSMCCRASIAEPSTMSRTPKPRMELPRRLVCATSVTTAPPRECPRRMIGGRDGQDNLEAVDCTMKTISDARVDRERSTGCGQVVRPWPRQSRDRMPAVGRMVIRDWKKVAKERPEEPAPWCVTIKGPLVVGVR